MLYESDRRLCILTCNVVGRKDACHGKILVHTEDIFKIAASLQSSLSYWSKQVIPIHIAKRVVWLKILEDQADLVPIAIKAYLFIITQSPGYVMLTFWLPDGPSGLPSTSLHQFGVGAFVINDKRRLQ